MKDLELTGRDWLTSSLFERYGNRKDMSDGILKLEQKEISTKANAGSPRVLTGTTPVVLLLPYPPRNDLGCVADPQVKLQLREQSFKPPRLHARFCSHTHLHPPVPPDHGRISSLPRGAAVPALAVPQSRYLQEQFVRSSGGNLLL